MLGDRSEVEDGTKSRSVYGWRHLSCSLAVVCILFCPAPVETRGDDLSGSFLIDGCFSLLPPVSCGGCWPIACGVGLEVDGLWMIMLMSTRCSADRIEFRSSPLHDSAQSRELKQCSHVKLRVTRDGKADQQRVILYLVARETCVGPDVDMALDSSRCAVSSEWDDDSCDKC